MDFVMLVLTIEHFMDDCGSHSVILFRFWCVIGRCLGNCARFAWSFISTRLYFFLIIVGLR